MKQENKYKIIIGVIVVLFIALAVGYRIYTIQANKKIMTKKINEQTGRSLEEIKDKNNSEIKDKEKNKKNKEENGKTHEISSEEEYQAKVKNAKGIVVVDYFATWCGPCVMMAPVVDEVNEAKDGFEIYKVDIDKQNKIAVDEGIIQLPTFKVFKDGKEVNKAIGPKTKEGLIEFAKQAK